MLFEKVFPARVGKFRAFPGPPPRFPLGNLTTFIGRRQPWEVCSDLCKQYGSVTLIWFLNKPALVLNDPAMIGEVLCGQWQEYYKQAPCEALAPVITRQSLFISNPPKWRAARGENPLSTVPFDDWFLGQASTIQDSIRQSLQHWTGRAGATDLYVETQRLSFQAFAQAFWGRRLPDDFFHWFQTLARTGDRRMKLPAQLLPPLSPFFYSARRSWYGELEKFVAEKRASSGGDESDLLSAALRQGSTLTDPAMAEALATNFFGGVFSCSSTINTALYLLARHPQERATLVDAIKSSVGDDTAYHIGSLDACQPLEFVLRETMRYYPAVPIYFRNVSKTAAAQLGGHELPADTLLMISNWYLHKFSDHWGDPQQFRPARWANGVAASHPVGSDYFFPFGRGPRMCIGVEFALKYMKLALATILLESDCRMDPDQPYKQNFFFGVMMPRLKAAFAAVQN